MYKNDVKDCLLKGICLLSTFPFLVGDFASKKRLVGWAQKTAREIGGFGQRFRHVCCAG
jgi:hypothetical protein